jgi:probable F420-dependent oxidoreductase
MARMAEYICAMRAIWSAWDSGDRLDFRGDFYSHTLMTPMFRPTGLRPAPKVYLAAVGEKMTEVVGEVADGLLLHPFTTPKYVRDVTLPALERGRACSGSDRSVEVVGGSFIVTGRTAEEFAESRSAVAERIAFYGSTPAYRPVFEAHGWADIGDELHRLSVSQDGDKWKRMGELISDEVLAEFAVVANPPDVGRAMQSRWGNVCSQYQLNTVGTTDTPFAMRVAATIRDS